MLGDGEGQAEQMVAVLDARQATTLQVTRKVNLIKQLALDLNQVCPATHPHPSLRPSQAPAQPVGTAVFDFTTCAVLLMCSQAFPSFLSPTPCPTCLVSNTFTPSPTPPTPPPPPNTTHPLSTIPAPPSLISVSAPSLVPLFLYQPYDSPYGPN